MATFVTFVTLSFRLQCSFIFRLSDRLVLGYSHVGVPPRSMALCMTYAHRNVPNVYLPLEKKHILCYSIYFFCSIQIYEYWPEKGQKDTQVNGAL